MRTHDAAWAAKLRMIGLMVLALIAVWFANAGVAEASGSTDPMVPCHAAFSGHDASGAGGGADHPHQETNSHNPGSCCAMSFCHAAIAAVAAGVYLPQRAGDRIGGPTDWTWQEARSRLERPPRAIA